MVSIASRGPERQRAFVSRPLHAPDSSRDVVRHATAMPASSQDASRDPGGTNPSGMTALDRPAIRAAARETLGHRTLLPGQAEAVGAITAGRDTLALLPTGGGKSAVYQLAGVSIDGPTVVVSPLIALQQDQLESLEELGLPAAAINSTRPA